MTERGSDIIFITGGTGFVGSALAMAWLERDADNAVVVQTRCPELTPTHQRIKYVASYDDVDQPIRALVNLAGAPIADKRWTTRRKKLLRDSRIKLTESLFDSLSRTRYIPATVLNASAIGFYGLGNSAYDELTPHGAGFAAELCCQWEQAAKQFEPLARLIILRLGVVLGDRGALNKLLPIFNLGIGGPIGDGSQWFSWIHITDVVCMIIESILNPEWNGTYNATSPKPVLQRDFARALGRALKRPAFLTVPSFVLSAIYGEMARELLIGGQKVLPRRAIDTGFEFAYPSLVPALHSILAHG